MTEIPKRAAGTTDTERLSRIVRGFKLCCHRGGVLRVTARDIAKTVCLYIKIFACLPRCAPVSAPARASDDGVLMRDFHQDDRVSHSRFGPGVVMAVDARYTIIEFDESGVRKFVTALV